MKRLCYILVLFTMLLGTSVYATEKSDPLLGFIDTIEFDWGYYKDEWFPTDFVKSDDCANTVNRFSIRAETSKILPWEKWRIRTEFYTHTPSPDELPDGKYWHIHNDGSHNSHDAGFREYSLNFTITRDIILKKLYLGIVFGLSGWYERDHGMHNLGDSHLLGTWGGIVGYKHRFCVSPWGVRGEVRATHTSDPCRSDMGKNYLGWNFGVVYYF